MDAEFTDNVQLKAGVTTMRLPFWLLRLLPRWAYICPKCRKTVEKSSHECPHCGERFPLAIRVPPFLKDPKKLEEYVHKHVFPRVSAFERAYLTQFFTEIFSDDFESGDFSAWTGTTTGGGGTATVEDVDPHHGSYNMKSTASHGGEGYAYTTFSSVAVAYMRAYLKFDALPDADADTLWMTYLCDDDDSDAVSACLRHDGANALWCLGVKIGGSWSWYYGTHTPSLNTYYCVEIKRDLTGQTAQLWIDGVSEADASSLSQVSNTAKARAGIYYNWLCPATTVRTDCVVIADAYIGPEEEGTLIEVADSLELAETILHNKAVILSDSLELADSLHGNKSLLLNDSASLSDIINVIVSEVTKYVTDSVSSADRISTPFRVLKTLEAIGAADDYAVNKFLQITETVSLAEIVEVGGGGVKKAKLFLIIGDLAVQLTGV